MRIVRRMTLVRTFGFGGFVAVASPPELELSAMPPRPPRPMTVAAAAIFAFTLFTWLYLLKRCEAIVGARPARDRQGRVKSGQNLAGGAVSRRYSGPMPTPATPGARILFVEDEESISAPFAEALRRAGFEPTVTRTAAGALELAEQLEPDLVLLDLALPDGDGRDVCRELRRHSDVPILMLTARGTELDRIVGLELGADDYVVKPFSAREVISRIRAVLRRSERAEPVEPVIEIGGLQLDGEARTAELDGRPLDLSRKEFDLLAELARHPGKVVKREDLMSRVWDVNWFGSTKTLDVHIGWLRRKLGDDPANPRFIETVRGVGFRFAAPEDAEP